jgi:DNA-binding NarL/FixJ family response regulator
MTNTELREAELRRTELAYRGVAYDAEALRQQRNAAVGRAIAEGWTHAQIAKATGLTRSRVGQIASGCVPDVEGFQ